MKKRKKSLKKSFFFLLICFMETKREELLLDRELTNQARIVVVDDDIAVLNSIKRILRRHFHVVTFSNPLEVEEYVRLNNVDLLLSDEMMPEMRGSELVKRIHSEFPKICKIILSGQAEKDDIVKAINLGGIFAFLFKPIDPEQLIQTINNGMENRKMKLKIIEQNQELQSANDMLSHSNNMNIKKNQELEKAYQELSAAHETLKTTQAQLIQSEKMAALGNLVAGIAHEVNNPIGAVMSASDVINRCMNKINLLSFDNTADSDLNKYLHMINDNNTIIVTASRRISKIVKSLKDFARLDEAEFQKADIRQGIESTLTLARHELKNKIDVIKEYDDIPHIHCYPNQLNQVFLNLFVNAAQAITDKGYIKIKLFTEKQYLCIQISDSGSGIPDENLKKIFDPGFTTKGVGVGSGLGLAISYNIIKKHNGTISVNSEVGKGTTFIISLPIEQIL